MVTSKWIVTWPVSIFHQPQRVVDTSEGFLSTLLTHFLTGNIFTILLLLFVLFLTIFLHFFMSDFLPSISVPIVVVTWLVGTPLNKLVFDKVTETKPNREKVYKRGFFLIKYFGKQIKTFSLYCNNGSPFLWHTLFICKFG